MRILIPVLLAASLCAVPATAHIVLSQPSAAPGARYVASFRIGHGCDGSATTAIRIEVPVNVSEARPQPKPGWTLTIEHVPLAKPITVKGKEIKERVSAVIWRGRLGDDQFDEFGLLVHLPDAVGTLFFPVVQSCEKGEIRWRDIPVDGQDIEHPAPSLQIGGDSMPGMDHMHMHH
jgi:uncharacterized protein YcnI